MPELWRHEEINPEATEKVIEDHPDLIKGVKLRIVGKLIASEGIAVVKTAQKSAKRFGLPSWSISGTAIGGYLRC
jgi:predicted amidohydrolase